MIFFFRERCLNFICEVELDIHPRTLFELLKNNLDQAQMLTYIFIHNLSQGQKGSWPNEIQFVFSDKNMEQWNVGSIYRDELSVKM